MDTTTEASAMGRACDLLLREESGLPEQGDTQPCPGGVAGRGRLHPTDQARFTHPGAAIGHFRIDPHRPVELADEQRAMLVFTMQSVDVLREIGERADLRELGVLDLVFPTQAPPGGL